MYIETHLYHYANHTQVSLDRYNNLFKRGSQKYFTFASPASLPSIRRVYERCLLQLRVQSIAQKRKCLSRPHRQAMSLRRDHCPDQTHDTNQDHDP